MTVPASLDALRARLAACLDEVADNDTYEAKRRLARCRRGDEHRRLARARGESWERDVAVALTRRIDGRVLDIREIRPRLSACITADDYATHRFFSAMSAFPTRDRPGRRMKLMLVDDGHPGSPVMAVATLSSAISSLRVRDAWIGWLPNRKGQRCWERLAYVMDLSTCIGVPPYGALTSAKLLAHLVVSDACLGMYRARYADRQTQRSRRTIGAYALVVATGAFKTKTPTYRGIKLDGRPIFTMIGKTRGYSSAHIPDDLYHELLQHLGGRRRGPHVRFSNLRGFARILGLDEERVIKPGQRRSVYVAQAALNAREFLEGKAEELDFNPPEANYLIDLWLRTWLAERARKAHIVRSISQPVTDHGAALRFAG